MKISQKMLSYDTTCSTLNYAGVKVNGMRDYSAINRKGLTQTTKKGIPLLARYAITVYPAIVNHDDGSGDDGKQIMFNGTGQAQSLVQCVFFGAPNNWGHT